MRPIPFLPFAFLLASITPVSAESKPVELLLASKTLQPDTSLELRFAEPMVRAEDVGQAEKTPPLVIRPALKGKFVWLSTRSGTFTPDEPWPLSTTFQITLRDELCSAEGRPCRLQLHETVQTPGLELKGWHSARYIDNNNAPVAPRVALLFNADIVPADAAPFTQFVSEGGAKVAGMIWKSGGGGESAEIVPAWRARDGSVLTWAERFRANANPAYPPKRDNQIVITPTQPLTPGMKWKLVLLAGLPAREEQVRLLNPVEIAVGAVRPFTVEASTATSRQSGRRIVLTFSKPLGSDVTVETFARWVQIVPQLPKMRVQIQGSQIELAGEFEIGTRYGVTVAAGLPSNEPVILSAAYSRGIIFKPMAPILAFQEFSTHQLSGGERRFHLLAVNVPRLRVTAKLFTAETLPLAVAAYENGSGKKLPPENLAGRTIWQQELQGTAEIDTDEEFSLAWDEIVGPHKTGAVLLTAEQIGGGQSAAPRVGTQALVQLTDLGMVWKSAKGELFVHVFSLTTQQAIAGVQLRALDEKQALLAEARTDASGIARLSCANADRLLASSAGDSHLVDLTDWQSRISLNRLRTRFADEDDDDEEAPAFIFSDRGVYKPGDTAHVKAVLSRGARRVLPPDGKARLRVSDPRDRDIVNKTVTISEHGSLSEDIVLPAGVGTYGVTLECNDAEHHEVPLGRHAFEVQDYRPNPFEVAIGGAANVVGAKEFALPVTAKYYMGKALAKAKLTWSLTAEDQRFEPAGLDAFEFCDAIREDRLNRELDRLSHFDDQGETDLDDHGTAKITARVPLNEKAPQPRMSRLLCEVTDLDQQTVSESANFTVHSSDFYLGLRRLPDVVREGEPLPIELIAVRSDGTPCTETVPVTVRVTRVDWQTNRVEAAGESTEFRSEPQLELIAENVRNTRAVTKENNRWVIDSTGEGDVMRAGRQGQYLLEATTHDNAGRAVVTTATFYVAGNGQEAWDYRNPFQVDVVSDKDTYRPGETATLLVKAPIDGEALVTVERETVLRSFIVHLSGSAPSVVIPVDGGDAPNVFVSIVLLRGSEQSPRKIKAPEYRIGYCELKIEQPESKLTVYVRPSSRSCQPGDNVVVDCEVLDFQGRPVPAAEVTLYAVDEGVLSLTGYQTPDPVAFFQQPRPLRVRTALTLPTLLDEDPDAREFVNKGYVVGGGGSEAGAERMRKNFVACAFWNATLRTDELGRLSATFAAPDSLTRYRVMAVAHARDDRFGSSEAAFEVNKPVMIEPALPRFANVGDKLLLRAVLHNTTEFDGQVDVVMTLDETARAEKTSAHLALVANGSAAVDFPVEMLKSGRAQWRWSADFTASDAKTAFRDLVQTELKVNYPAAVLREVRVCRVDSGKVQSVDGIDPRILEGNGTMRVSITNSRSVELQEALRQLLHYPYGCVEQTTSSTLPWLGLHRLRGALPTLQRTDAEVAGAIQHGVDRLLSMQTTSGGLGYWPGAAEPMFWGSAYGGMGLVLAKKAGADVPGQDFDRLMKYLSDELRGAGEKNDHYGLGPCCLALYTLALAGRAEPAYHELLFKKREKLSDENRALLALAVAESNGSAEMIEQLLATSSVPPASDVWFNSPSRSIALRLLACCRSGAAAPRTEALAADLLGQRRVGHWATTQGNAWAFLAMGEYFERVESGHLAAAGAIEWGPRNERFAFENRVHSFVTTIPISPDDGPRELRFSNTGSSPIFAEVDVESQPASLEQMEHDAGYGIRRTYSKIDDDGRLVELGDAQVGDRVLVSLSIEVRRAAEYLAIDDPLPAIFEPLNPVFKTQETRAGTALTLEWWSSHKELREDRALFFADTIAPGRYTLRYLARVCAAGTATAPSAKVEEMYHPERFGLSGSAKVTSHPLE